MTRFALPLAGALLLLPVAASAQAGDSAFVAESLKIAQGSAEVRADSAAQLEHRRQEALEVLRRPVRFAPGSTALDSAARELVIRQAWYLYLNPALTVRLRAHPDRGLADDPALTQARARNDAVRGLLQSRAIDLQRVAADEVLSPADSMSGVVEVETTGDLRVLDTPPPDAEPPRLQPPGAHVGPGGNRRPAWGTVRVFYATDREPTGKSDVENFYAGERSSSGALAFGRIEVSIPRIHRTGVVERPVWYRIQWTATPDRHMMVNAIQPLSQRTMLDSVRRVVAASGSKEALVFIHGYNVSFHEAALRTAQLTYDLGFDGAPVLYSWPSRGSLFGYSSDRESAEWSAAHLRRFLDSLVAITGARKLNVIAHSMGNRVLTLALQRSFQPPLQPVPFANIVLAAPDVDATQFEQQLADSLRPLTQRLTIYMSRKDKALRTSRWLSTHRRLGEATDPILVVRDADTIDASDIDTDLLGHGYIASNRDVIDDLILLVEQKRAPPRIRLQPASQNGAAYWLLP
ncbi:MAG TPA: alpha/beta fold hydrolase [Gemmatimonadales bacterium]|jgi:Uncharacterized protein conserved in bacteria